MLYFWIVNLTFVNVKFTAYILEPLFVTEVLQLTCLTNASQSQLDISA